MNTLCPLVDRFFDGELSPAEADAFRQHLVVCDGCTRALGERVRFDAMIESNRESARGAVRRGQLVQPRPSFLRRVAPALGGLALAAASIGVLLGGAKLLSQKGARGGEVALLSEPTRGVEVRFTYGPLDTHRPYSPKRGAAVARDVIPLAKLAELEAAQQYRGLAAALVLAGEVKSASQRIAKASPSDDTSSDEAAIAIEEGRPEEAITLVEPVLAHAPNHPQALWNRALALTALDLPLLAAAAWQKLAELNEVGWSAEARDRADALSAAYGAHRRKWENQLASARAMVLEGAIPDAETMRGNPSLFRNAFYHAVNAAPSLERIVALRAVAASLSGDDPTGALLRRLAEVSASRLARRQPFITRYIALYKDGPTGDGTSAVKLIEELRALGDDDLFFGAVDRAALWREYARDLERIAARSPDPWMGLVAQRAEAKVAEGDGAYARADKTLREAVAQSDRLHFGYLSARLEYQRVTLLAAAYRTREADHAAVAAFSRADAFLDSYNQTLRSMLALDAAKRGEYGVARAYAFDAMLREPTFCAGRADAFQISAEGYVKNLDPEAAAHELREGPLCDGSFLRGAQSPFERATVLALLARVGVRLPETEHLLEDLNSARPHWTRGARLHADAIEGDLLLLSDLDRGRNLLQATVKSARDLPFDADAEAAADFGVLSLAWLAARDGDGRGVAHLFAEQANLAETRCTLSLGADHERVFSAVGRADGTFGVTANPHAPSYPPPLELLTPRDSTSGLDGCAAVAVLTRAPVFGLPKLLPPSTAWSYRVSGARYGVVSNATAKRLIVSDVTPPAELGLRALGSLHVAVDPTVTWLRGTEATVGSVLREMEDATEVQLHAHGLTDLGDSDAPVVALSSDSNGKWALSARDVGSLQLRGHPVVLLAACDAARYSRALHQHWSLPVAFVRAGARAVIASTEAIPDAESRDLFESILQRIRAGAAPASALRDERIARLNAGRDEWIGSLILFE